MKRILLLLCVLIGAFALTAREASEPGDGLYARIATPRGDFLFELDYRNLPLTVSNFVAQAENKMDPSFYGDLSVYRAIPGYALFAGDPSGTGRGGAAYSFPREAGGRFSAAAPGALLMDSLQGEDQGSRFFILPGGDAFLDSKYTAFGQLSKGDPEKLKKLNAGDALSISILRIGSEAEAFRPGREEVEALIAAARKAEREKFAAENPQVAQVLEALGDDTQRSETGIFYKVHAPGSGEKPRPGDTVRMHYAGRLITGQEFDNSYSRGEPFSFTLGKDGVIPGWVETALSMQPGEQRTVVLPPRLAYGERGYGPIPPDSWLIFDIELIDFQ